MTLPLCRIYQKYPLANGLCYQTTTSALSAPLFHTEPILASPTLPRLDSAYAAITPASTPTGQPPETSGSNALHKGTGSSDCTCLQQQVELVYQLGGLQDFQAGGPTVDRVLHCVELAQVPWDNLMQCALNHNPEQQKHIFQLFATSIRILLSSVQRLDAESRLPDSPDNVPDGRTGQETTKLVVSVGNFELFGEAKSEDIAMVLRRAQKSVTSALYYLRGRVDTNRSPSTSTNNGAPESPDPLQFPMLIQ